MTRRLRLLGRPPAALAAITFMILLLAHGAEAGYNPSLQFRYCNGLAADFPATISFNDPDLQGSPGCAGPAVAAPQTSYPATLEMSLPSGDYSVGGLYLAGLSAGHFIAPDADIPDGQKIGGVSVLSNFGLLNGACNTPLTVEFILYESTTNPARTYAPIYGAGGPFANLVTDADAHNNFGDASSIFVTENPLFYARMFDPDFDAVGVLNGPIPHVVPRARYTGMTRVPAGSGDWQILSFFQFDPGVLGPFNADPDNKPHPLGRASRAPAGDSLLVGMLNDPTSTVFANSPVSDVCTPTSVKLMLRGTAPSGQVRFTTPAAPGTATVSLWSHSQRDADGDGTQNANDTCPYTANTGVDSDGDGIDNACDSAYTPNNIDVDGDGFPNRGDNCPVLSNGGSAQRDGENATTYLIAAPLGGPRTDGIGDVCDSQPTVANGAFVERYNYAPKCIGGTDSDGDGYCAVEDVDDTNSSIKGYSLNGGFDMDGVPSGDQFGANVEVYVGTDALLRCNATYTANDEPVDAWPADVDDTRSVNITDVLAQKPYFGQNVPPAPQRFDLVPSRSINIADVLALKAPFGTSC